MRGVQASGAVWLSFILAGCALSSLPPLSDDYRFPVDELVRFTACELRDAYRELSKPNYRFRAKEYAISIQLQPKTEITNTLKAGLTGTSKRAGASDVFFNTWNVGGAGGATGGLDAFVHQDGSVTFNVKSAQLLNKANNLDCENWSSAKPVLVTNLQIRDWLIRTATTTRPTGALAIDKHGFFAEVTITWDIGGGFTYNFPYGTDLIGASAKAKLDEILSVTIAHEDPAADLSGFVTLPSGGNFEVNRSQQVRARAAISPETKTRLDLQQLQQSIQNLQINQR